MCDKELFEMNGNIVILQKRKGESRNHFLIRSGFILKNLYKIKNGYELDTIVSKSFLFLNRIIHKDRYESSTEKDLFENYDCEII